MPKGNFKSLTVSESLYAKIESSFKILKQNNALPPGINSISSYLVYKITTKLDDGAKLRKLALKINNIPSEFLESKIRTGGRTF